MKKLIPLVAGLVMTLSSLNAHAAIVTRDIDYTDGDVALRGYYTYDDAIKTPRPGVIVVHEWWGLNDYAKRRAKELAEMGYAAFAVNMYGTGVTADTPATATETSAPFYKDRALMSGRAKAGLDVLAAQPEVDKTKLAAIGFCFGGTTVLELARSGADIKGVVSFHGGLATPAPAKEGSIKGAVLALNGGADPMVAQAEKDAFAKEMQAAKVNFKSIDYAGATHAFTNPDATAIGEKFKIPVAYNPEAEKQSMGEMKKFLHTIFK